MLPPSVHSTYCEYKHDTNSIAAWLASTAKSLGYRLEDLSPNTRTADAVSSQNASASGRLKGKARANAKKHAVAMSWSNPEDPAKDASASSKPKTKYIISVKDFRALSAFLVEKKAPEPLAFQSTLNRAIRARTAFAAKTNECNWQTDEESTNQHEFFVNVLRDCRDTLQCLMPASANSEPADKDSEKLSIRFVNLTIYEPSHGIDDVPVSGIERPLPTMHDAAVYEVEAESSVHEAVFALVLCL